jgi:tRNA(Ile)-lysidine synthase
MSLLKRYKERIQQENLFSANDKLLLAVSGGVDSVVLCELCKQAGYDFVIAHCNFQLRGKESERDKEFVKQLATKYGVDFLVTDFETDTYAKENKISTQEAARELRYNWFKEIITNWKLGKSNKEKDGSLPAARYFLLTAHHADDNIETLLMNFFRGTGLHGMTGIATKASSGILNYIRRPLLSFSKEELVAFAKENELEWVEDSSNESSKYTRNFFRNELIPAISKVYPQVKENLADNINRFKEIEKLYQVSVAAVIKKLCRQKGNEVHIPVKQLMGYNNKALTYEIIHQYGFNEKQVEEVEKLAMSDSGKFIVAPDNTYRIIKHRHWFIISPMESKEAENIVIEEGISNIQFAIGSMQIEALSGNNLSLPAGNTIAALDIKDIMFPLLLRKWKTGDYFYPLGMSKKKKVARFLIDQKLSVADKEKVWVIESNKRILWVVGHRIDDRFKITANTKKVLQLRLQY